MLAANDNWFGVISVSSPSCAPKPYHLTYKDPTWSRRRPYHFTLHVTPHLKYDYCRDFSDGYLEYSEKDAAGPIYQCVWRTIRTELDPANSRIDVYVRAKSPRPWMPFFLYNLKSWFFNMPIYNDGQHGTGGVKVVGSSATGPGSFGGGHHLDDPSANEDIETFNIPT
jgi:hypothetical protein